MDKKIGAVLLSTLLAFTIVGCGGNDSSNKKDSSAGGKNQIVMKLGHGQTEAHPYHLGAKRFAELVDKYTSGSVKVDIHPNATLGAERDMVEGVSMGTIDACITTNAPLTNFDDKFNVFEFPYLFKTREEAQKILDGKIGQNLLKGLESKNIIGLSYFENGFRNITNSKKEIKTVKDLEGMKIRTMESSIHVASFKAMGANPTPMNWGEVYTALAQGTIDGQENPPMAILDGKIYEVNKYMSMTHHFYSPAELLMRKDLFDKMSDDQKKGVKKAAVEAAAYEREQAEKFNTGKIDELKKNGMQVTEVDVTSFSNACQKVYKEFDSKYGAQLKEIRAALGR
jgi:tripartite ATP-independent transporter DctP family solute receptor